MPPSQYRTYRYHARDLEWDVEVDYGCVIVIYRKRGLRVGLRNMAGAEALNDPHIPSEMRTQILTLALEGLNIHEDLTVPF